MNKKFPCRCGHLEEMHNPDKWKNKPYINATYLPTACYQYIIINEIQNICDCNEYVRDNLEYFKIQYDEMKK